jgi:Fe-Mn family superoxide dismutase
MKPAPSADISRRQALKTLGLGAAAMGMLSTITSPVLAADSPPAPPVPDGPLKLPELGYAYDALAPVIGEETMEIHHTKHHLAYVVKANIAIAAQPELGELGAEGILQSMNEVSGGIRNDIRNNVGGFVNHNLFFDILTPGGAKEPHGRLASQIDKDFGNFGEFSRRLSATANARFGAGWAWLAVYNEKLIIMSTANQDSPLMDGATPILGLDVWEHAYYLDYRYKRGEYVTKLLTVINWDRVGERFKEARA